MQEINNRKRKADLQGEPIKETLVLHERKHISEEMWDALQTDSIGQKDFVNILQHTCTCTGCAQRLAQSMETEDNIRHQPPTYLKDEIIKRTRQLNIQTAVTVKRTSRQIQLMIYSLKVGMAVVVSVLILGFTSNLQDIQFSQLERPKRVEREESVTDKMSGAMNGITDILNDFSNHILKGGK